MLAIIRFNFLALKFLLYPKLFLNIPSPTFSFVSFFISLSLSTINHHKSSSLYIFKSLIVPFVYVIVVRPGISISKIFNSFSHHSTVYIYILYIYVSISLISHLSFYIACIHCIAFRFSYNSTMQLFNSSLPCVIALPSALNFPISQLISAMHPI